MITAMDLAGAFPASDLTVVAVVTALFCTLFAVAEIWWRTGQPPVEYTRKFLHVGCGLIAAPLAWLIESPWTMLLLGSGFVAIVGFTRRMGWLPCMHAVERCSHGAALYPASIFLTYLIAFHTDRPELYSAAVLVLALSDAAASLVGLRFGTHPLLVEDDVKSIEGSIAFFATAQIVIFATLALLTDLSLPVCLLCATYTAGLVACVELLSLSGADNLFIPLTVIGILLKITASDVDELLRQLGLLVPGFAVVTALLRLRSRVIRRSIHPTWLSLLLAVGIGSWHALLDPLAFWWLDVGALFVATLLYASVAECWFKSQEALRNPNHTWRSHAALVQ